MDEGIINDISTILPYKMEPIDEGFKYLGYRLKPLGYGINYWRWIIKNFEKQISRWSYKFLSLGGRLILIRSVLSGVTIYLFNLSIILRSILDILRQCIFSFLWGSTYHKWRMKLVDWLTISSPYDYGEWKIKNLEWFCTSLRLKSIWMVIKWLGMWNNIICNKYLKNMSIEDWLCKQ